MSPSWPFFNSSETVVSSLEAHMICTTYSFCCERLRTEQLFLQRCMQILAMVLLQTPTWFTGKSQWISPNHAAGMLSSTAPNMTHKWCCNHPSALWCTQEPQSKWSSCYCWKQIRKLWKQPAVLLSINICLDKSTYTDGSQQHYSSQSGFVLFFGNYSLTPVYFTSLPQSIYGLF